MSFDSTVFIGDDLDAFEGEYEESNLEEILGKFVLTGLVILSFPLGVVHQVHFSTYFDIEWLA